MPFSLHGNPSDFRWQSPYHRGYYLKRWLDGPRDLVRKHTVVEVGNVTFRGTDAARGGGVRNARVMCRRRGLADVDPGAHKLYFGELAAVYVQEAPRCLPDLGIAELAFARWWAPCDVKTGLDKVLGMPTVLTNSQDEVGSFELCSVLAPTHIWLVQSTSAVNQLVAQHRDRKFLEKYFEA